MHATSAVRTKNANQCENTDAQQHLLTSSIDGQQATAFCHVEGDVSRLSSRQALVAEENKRVDNSSKSGRNFDKFT